MKKITQRLDYSTDTSGKNQNRLTPKLILFFAGALLVLAFGSGCKSSKDPENLSARPWNSPQTWEHGVPAAIYEGR